MGSKRKKLTKNNLITLVVFIVRSDDFFITWLLEFIKQKISGSNKQDRQLSKLRMTEFTTDSVKEL
jgi:hypothetical protein